MTVCVANTVAESGSPRVRRCITSVGPKQSRRRCRRCRLARLLPDKGSHARRRPHAHRGGNSDRPARCQAHRTGVIPASPKRSPDTGRRDDNRPVRGSRDARDLRKPQAAGLPAGRSVAHVCLLRNLRIDSGESAVTMRSADSGPVRAMATGPGRRCVSSDGVYDSVHGRLCRPLPRARRIRLAPSSLVLARITGPRAGSRTLLLRCDRHRRDGASRTDGEILLALIDDRDP